ncbi:MAG: ABC transporter ATP-binding protein [Gammaproteobacteria bacterium]|nr:ABC transporter ATP-binding protein [Gammaproteobacteria bacterium]
MQLIDIYYYMGASPLFKSLNATFISGLTGIVGANGCGKSTLLRILGGLLKPTQGKVFVHEQDLYANHSRLCSRIGYVATKPFLYPHLTIKENLCFIAKLHHQKRIALQLGQVLEQCNIKQYQHVLFGHCSDGVKKRIMIASALIHQPNVLILDEPCAELDPSQRQQLWTLLLHLRDEGKTIIFSSHHPQEFAEHCGAIYQLAHGQLQVLTHYETMTQLWLQPNHKNPAKLIVEEKK